MTIEKLCTCHDTDALKKLDPLYNKQEDAIEDLSTLKMIATAGVIFSVVTAVFGALSLLFSGGLAIGVAASHFASAMTLGYVAYNARQVLSNMVSVLSNPSKTSVFSDMFAVRKDLKTKLCKGTIGFSWCVNLIFKDVRKWLESKTALNYR